MKIYVSYFYQVRFFPKNLIPLSTAHSDPKWYHANQGLHYQFFDKRGVLNGLRAEPFVPQMTSDGECSGQPCTHSPLNCGFLSNYHKQLNMLDFNLIMERFTKLHDKLAADLQCPDVDFALMVYEAPANPCSERQIILKWFAEHGMPIQEWRKWEII